MKQIIKPHFDFGMNELTNDSLALDLGYILDRIGTNSYVIPGESCQMHDARIV